VGQCLGMSPDGLTATTETADEDAMRLATIAVVLAATFVVAGCSAHGPAPPDATAARRAVNAAASTVSTVGRIDGLSCRTGTPTQHNHVYGQSGGVWIEPGRDVDR
jgi:hypothetical protein